MEIEKTDEELIKACQSGERNNLNILLERYEILLRYFLLTLYRIKDDSFFDDIIQEIFITVFKKIISRAFVPKGAGSFQSWIYQVARNKYLKANERRRGKPKPLSEIYPEELPDDLIATRPEPVIDPVVLTKLRTKLARALDSLRPNDRKLFELRRDGLSYQQIKETKETPEFQKFSLGRLRLKYYEIMEKLKIILLKRRNANESEAKRSHDECRGM